MATMEGPLSKWTNVMKGWQYRWFVLDDNSGLLSYYTSKEKMMRGTRRGCVILKGAVIGIDDEDDSTFTITVDQKTFHFQARDADERERWIEALENTVLRHSHIGQRSGAQASYKMEDFDHKLMETDTYLQLLIDQVETLENKIAACPDELAKEKYTVIKVKADDMIEAIKHTIMMLQISKESLKEPVLNATYPPLITESANFTHFGSQKTAVTSLSAENIDQAQDVLTDDSLSASVSLPNLATPVITENLQDGEARLLHEIVESPPATSYSSSEDDEFYDAEDQKTSSKSTPEHELRSSDNVSEIDTTSPPVITSQDDVYDELYDEVDKEDLGSLEQHGSIVAHLLSQVRIGMDLTKVVLPTFILERRSLLEMFADFFAHPDLFLKVVEFDSPRERMIQMVRWYLSAFHAGRPSEVAKKPYNPILGETFLCEWRMPDEDYSKSGKVENGPVSWATKDNLSFIAEQVSHHPPISAFYAEHFNKRITLDGYIWTKSKFLGLSIGVHMIGQAVVSLLDFDEHYTITFPNGYGRSILTVPWVELGSKVHITCAKTGYNATIDFLTKPFYGGKKHQISGQINDPNEKKPIVTIQGEWNGVMYAKFDTGHSETFVDTKNLPIIKKRVQPREQQDEFESRRLWQDVTHHLKMKNVVEATESKHKLEQRQREEAKERKEAGVKWETKHFHEVGEHWVYDRSLLQRMNLSANSSPQAQS
ncbi:oxysterol-binding protein-related protein 9 [Patella vulgata]|uniref:oxysterol-binding protein-related protein 9 n=1 Tax=Patella vulgata TaxID=6465 RepID=UPI00217F60FA|nr:oxysterol-binding protein-related protein 9 [Patella vulgata]